MNIIDYEKELKEARELLKKEKAKIHKTKIICLCFAIFFMIASLFFVVAGIITNNVVLIVKYGFMFVTILVTTILIYKLN